MENTFKTMDTEFFQQNAPPLDQFTGIYDLKLVALSFIVAIMASYIALDFTRRLRDRNNTKNDIFLWLIGGAVAMGSGIWSMHFIGMLSFSIPGLFLQYDLFWTLLSLFVAIFASGFALFLLKKSIINVIHLIAGGVILGLAIASMHYTGMMAMLISLNIKYLPGLFFLSILIAIIASEAAIWLALKSNTVIARLRNRVKLSSAILMGLAICGMHYTGMAASVFSPLCASSAIIKSQSMDPTVLAIMVAGATLLILGIAFFASNYKEAKNLQQFEKARELGIAEISASVLHNVGNVLNSVNISIETLVEGKNNSPLNGLRKLVVLLQQHKDNLPHFLSEDPQGKLVMPYFEELTTEWEKEHHQEVDELENIAKNITLIKSIISTQQEANKADGYEQVISLHELIDEALLISGIYLKKDITLHKEYGDIKSILIDKTKLFQVLSNIIKNAIEALLESANTNKTLTIKTSLFSPEKLEIQIIDNGIGITKATLDKIFIFGFTTKKSGHGFGLHATALALNELGGEIRVHSDGYEKGTSFIIYLPNRRARL